MTTTKIPSIPSVYGLVLEQGKYDLSKKSWAKAGEFQKLDYIKQMLEVVRHINEKGYIWRDVKPTNFVFFDDRLKGIDFDISLANKVVKYFNPPADKKNIIKNNSSLEDFKNLVLKTLNL